MRFRAKLRDATLLLHLIQTVEKIDKQCTVHLTPKRIQFILVKEAELGYQVWSSMNAASLFNEYHIESKADNEISFQINLNHLGRALKCGERNPSQEILIKLTRKGDIPYLSLTMEISTTRSMKLTQDVPILPMSPEQMSNFIEPELPNPDIIIMMPPLKAMKNVIKRMKDLHKTLMIRANMNGELTLKVQTELVSIATFYRHLEHPQIDGGTRNEGPDTIASVQVDVTKFWKALYSYQVSPSHVICCIIEEVALVLHALLDDFFITYYIPIITAS